MTETTEDPILKPRERQELRSVIKNDFKVLRTEIDYKAEYILDNIEQAVTEELSSTLMLAQKAFTEEQKLIDKFQEQFATLLNKYSELNVVPKNTRGYPRSATITCKENLNPYTWVPANLDEKISATRKQIDIEKRKALLEIDRQEADILRELAVEGLPVSASKKFLDDIPKVKELMPSTSHFVGVIEASVAE